MAEKVDERIAREAKRLAEEDYSLIANMVSGVTNKQKYVESRTEHYIKKLLKKQ
ncbi:MAG: hypothetical protein QT11_C0001G0121 [archaeon GW2011_AR20]|nr:MAG: hypothetical protein QT11_C0001G0121 [archaeon GW2011_AR20]MBS3160703.1 hypothetical protein [Candidatus Woesearchaeota archaeon]